MSDRTLLMRDVLRGIEASRDDLSGALGRIADFILREPEAVVQASMSELGSDAGECRILR